MRRAIVGSKDWLVEYVGYTTAISGKRQEMDSELVCPTPYLSNPLSYYMYKFILSHVMLSAKLVHTYICIGLICIQNQQKELLMTFSHKYVQATRNTLHGASLLSPRQLPICMYCTVHNLYTLLYRFRQNSFTWIKVRRGRAQIEPLINFNLLVF